VLYSRLPELASRLRQLEKIILAAGPGLQEEGSKD
jgi:hypothetical protein